MAKQTRDQLTAQRRYRETHRDSVQAARRKYRHSEEGRRKSRDYRLRKEYGITPDRFDQMLAAQGGTCAVCLRPESRIARNMVSVGQLSVDHNHRTGKVRSLLCHACNSAIGLLEENSDRMRALAAYIEAHDKRDMD